MEKIGETTGEKDCEMLNISRSYSQEDKEQKHILHIMHMCHTTCVWGMVDMQIWLDQMRWDLIRFGSDFDLNLGSDLDLGSVIFLWM